MGNATVVKVNGYFSEPVDAITFQALIVSWALLGLLSAGLNILVCAMVIHDKKLRTMTNYLVLSLSVSDLMIAVVFVPVYIIDHYAKTVIAGYFVAFVLLATVFNLCGVTYERYIALTRPFRYRAIINNQNVSLIIGISWILPLIISLLPLAWNTDASSTIHKAYLAIILATCIFIPSTTMVCVYMSLLRVVHRFVIRNKKRTCNGNNTGYRAGNEEKAARVFAIVLLMFLVCWLPLIYINICLITDQRQLLSNELIIISFYTLVLNSILDPVIFALYKKDFRDTLKKRLRLKCPGTDQNGSPKEDSDMCLRKLSLKTHNFEEATSP
ncbi:D(4) dopamine receptor-like [Stylophora pistillata]|uniref:D(4) dopamine receptor-like n=1 Tax=Stylophora pistillata TaxID=50429 RepID=UPI000C03D31D|nr:D(4) dopamine receptor-like [Stylophora pistillata]